MAHLTKDPNNPLRWVVVYPAFIDANATLAEGRKIAKEKSVEAPTLKEMFEALDKKKSGLDITVEENKSYPRSFGTPGRFRVHLKNETGAPINPAIKSRTALYEFIAESIAKTPARVAKKAQQAQQAAAEAEKAERERLEKEKKSKK